MAAFLLKILIGGNFLPLAVNASTSEAGFLVTSCMDGYAADALLLDCTVHWDVKLEWYLIHIDDIVITNLVVGNLLLDKGTEWLQYELAP